MSASDPNLRLYNCIDASATITIRNQILAELRQRWSTLSPLIDRDAFRSDLLWTTVHMAEAGVAFDLASLTRLSATTDLTRKHHLSTGKTASYTLGGKGSVASVRSLITIALEHANLLDDPRVEITAKRREISSGKNNVQLILGHLPTIDPIYPIVSAFYQYTLASKLITSYIKPILSNPAKGCVSSNIAYPDWFPVPAHVKDDQGEEGGTRQGRFSAHNPAIQTLPPPIKSTLCSRYPGGILRSYDLSQVELRTATLLSGEPSMIETYHTNQSIHHQTTTHIFPGLTTEDPTYPKKYKLGKQLNFLTLYRGGAALFVVICRKRLGIDITLDFATSAIASFWEHRRTLWNWQQSLIAQVQQSGYLVLPTGWRRTFVRSDFIVEETYINEICNMPVQTLSAQVLESAQATIRREFAAHHLHVVMPAQVHDDILTDAAPEHAAAADAIVRRTLSSPTLWNQLCTIYGRNIPLAFEAKTLYPNLSPSALKATTTTTLTQNNE